MHDLGWVELHSSTGSSTASSRSTPSSWPASGTPRASPWRFSWPAFAPSTSDLVKAAQIDGAGPGRIYWRVAAAGDPADLHRRAGHPLQFAIKTFDLVLALTSGGPGIATTVPGHRSLRLHVPARPDRPGRGRGHHDAPGPGGRSGALRLLHPLAAPPGRQPMASAAPARPGPVGTGLASGRSSMGCFACFAAYAIIPCRGSGAELVQDAAGDRPHLASGPAAVASTSRTSLDAWSKICVGGICEGIQPFIWNSFRMVIPATIISTAIGAINGYALSLWRFRGADADLRRHDHGRVHSRPDGAAALGDHAGLPRPHQHHGRPRPDPCHPGAELHDAVLPQLLRQHAGGPDQGGADRRCRLLPHLLAHRAAALAADPDRHA